MADTAVLIVFPASMVIIIAMNTLVEVMHFAAAHFSEDRYKFMEISIK